MRITLGTLSGLATAAAVVLVPASPAVSSAQAPPPAAGQAQAQQMGSPVEGDLVSVDPDAKIIKVKNATGAELQFTYSEKTEVSGAQKDAAGLATLREGRVTVHFTEDAKTKVKTATRIIVQPKG